MSHRRRERTIAVCLTAISGYVDALGFMHLGGYFVSFMSGNSTRLGVGLEHGINRAAMPAALTGLFVAGVMLGTLTGRRGGAHRRVAVLALVFALLASAALCHTGRHDIVTIALIALAMGAENTVFERNGEVAIGITYMTGTLVKLGQRITLALLGGDRLGWLWHLLLWLGLIGGTALGAAAYSRLGLNALWPAVLASGLVTLIMAGVPETRAPNAATEPDRAEA